jgi:hypothetical protein
VTTESRDVWQAPDFEVPVTERVFTAERQLALVDRIIGLEAQLAELAAVSTLTPAEQLRSEHQLQQVRSSLTWRVGTAALLPARLLRGVARRLVRR